MSGLLTKRSRRWLWITDPWLTLDHPFDTTLRLIEEGLLLGIPQYWCDVKTIHLATSEVQLIAHEIVKVRPGRNADSFSLKPPSPFKPEEFNAIHYRTDPPVDQSYLHPLQMLSLGLNGTKARKTEFVNPLSVLFTLNEKMLAASLGGLAPPCQVSSEEGRLYSFGKKEKKAVLKPLHLAQSLGVELLDWSTPTLAREARAKLKAATLNFTAPVMLQKYLKGIQEGELRLWFLDGDLLACIKKLPLSGDFRVNIDQGSKLARAPQLTRGEKTKAGKISSFLRKTKIRLAAVDLIDGYVTDFNFTSPGLIPKMEVLLGENLAQTIVKNLKSSFKA